MIARICRNNNDFAKSNVYCERQLSIANEMNNLESQASALLVLGYNYRCMGDYGKAMAYLGQALVIASELGGDRIGLTYRAMGDVLVAQEVREKEAILGSLRKAMPQQYLWGGSSNLARHTRQLGLGTMLSHLCRKASRSNIARYIHSINLSNGHAAPTVHNVFCEYSGYFCEVERKL